MTVSAAAASGGIDLLACGVAEFGLRQLDRVGAHSQNRCWFLRPDYAGV